MGKVGVAMNIKSAISWMNQPGIVAMMPQDPHTKEAMRVILNFVEKQIEEKEPVKKIRYKIYFSSAAGMEYAGILCTTENEAKALCEKYNKQNPNSFGQYVCMKEEV